MFEYLTFRTQKADRVWEICWFVSSNPTFSFKNCRPIHPNVLKSEIDNGTLHIHSYLDKRSRAHAGYELLIGGENGVLEARHFFGPFLLSTGRAFTRCLT